MAATALASRADIEAAEKRLYEVEQKYATDKAMKRFSESVSVGYAYPEVAPLVSSDPVQAWSQLASNDKDLISTIGHTYQDGALSLMLMPGTSSSGDRAHVLTLHPSIKLTSTTIHNEPFGTFVATRIVDDGDLSDALFKTDMRSKFVDGMRSRINDTSTAPSISEVFNAEVPHQDAKLWSAQLNGYDSRVGIYSMNLGGGRKAYFLAANSNAGPIISQELKDIIRTEKPTAREFARDPRILFARDIGERNSKRLLYHAADVLGVKIDHEKDMRAFVPPHHEDRMLGIPHISTSYNTLAAVPWENSVGEAIAFYNDCTDGSRSKVSAVVVGDPIDDLMEYQGKDISDADYRIRNDTLNALPSITSAISETDRVSALSEAAASTRESVASTISTLDGSDPTDHSYSIRSIHDTSIIAKKMGMYGLSSTAGHTRRLSPVLILTTGSLSTQ